MNPSLSQLLQLVRNPGNASHCFAIDVGANLHVCNMPSLVPAL